MERVETLPKFLPRIESAFQPGSGDVLKPGSRRLNGVPQCAPADRLEANVGNQLEEDLWPVNPHSMS